MKLFSFATQREIKIQKFSKMLVQAIITELINEFYGTLPRQA